MAPQIGFHTEGTAYRLRGKRAVARWIARTVEEEGLEAGRIDFIFCSPEVHLDINRRYLGHDYPTDVITFDYTEGNTVSGDIFIDPTTVRSNARLYGETARREMMRVIIHGVLHLCGYKDKTPSQASTMRSLENRYLGRIDFE